MIQTNGKIGLFITLSPENYKWLEEQTKTGISKTTILNACLDIYRKANTNEIDLIKYLKGEKNYE